MFNPQVGGRSDLCTGREAGLKPILNSHIIIELNQEMIVL